MIPASVLDDLYQLAKRQGWLESLRRALKKKHRILVLGSTGVGKTNLIESLKEITTPPIDRKTRTEIATRHKLEVADNLFEFIDTPGQELHASARQDEYREALKSGVSAIMNVVAYGYHEYGIDRKSAITKAKSARASFVTAHRNVEMNALDEWAYLLATEDVTKWLLTVVTKADLWWDKRTGVLKHYRSGPYYQRLRKNTDLDHTVIEFCAVFHKFFGVAPLSGSFDDEDRHRARRHLLETLLAAIGKAHSNG